jgi:hypothetical protein
MARPLPGQAIQTDSRGITHAPQLCSVDCKRYLSANIALWLLLAHFFEDGDCKRLFEESHLCIDTRVSLGYMLMGSLKGYTCKFPLNKMKWSKTFISNCNPGVELDLISSEIFCNIMS